MSRWPGNAEKERTTFGELNRSQLMSRVRSVGNLTTEKRLASLLRKNHLTGWRRRQNLPGKPDFAWAEKKVAVFVDGCFWHGHGCGRNLKPRKNAREWQDKINKTKIRDRRIARILRRLGWTVIRIWECGLSGCPERCVGRIKRQLGKRG